ncbi:MAG: hypothetical protein AVO35_07790 [Candidatus Aegiribacteria sp. MLS_C]|nr:MAG: hypothetical protein AVO35_07790 [Candidatus Aegiribacteria sp. MLS_C]
MDFDGSDYWTTNGTGGGLRRFQPGVDLTCLGEAPIPASCTSSPGLACSYNTDTMFWSCNSSVGYMVSEFSVDFGTALQQETRGAIKSAFQADPAALWQGSPAFRAGLPIHVR